MANRDGGCNLRRCDLCARLRCEILRVAAPALRHCEELLRRSNPGCLRGESLDCFAALAMTGVAAVARTPPAMSPGRPWNSSTPLIRH
ncbi:hypothetical protein CT676_14860 [Bradyrhizobium sp. MOS001]|nr:hypothetical protein CT676_14860 [Bradyrhizobium sp. MOS001]